MMTYSGNFTLTLAHGQYIGAESSSAENNKVNHPCLKAEACESKP